MQDELLDFEGNPENLGPENNVGFGLRLAAIIIDGILLWSVQAVITYAMFGTWTMQPEDPMDPMSIFGPDYYTLMGISTFFGIVYHVGMWVYADGATLGKKAVKIKVVRNDDGGPIGIGTAIGRYFSYILSYIPCFLGFLWVIWDNEKRGWHDKICNTKVVPAEAK
ncbi:RDD family protein [Flammeovirgaceae bacterium SG7u.111]|nr:RDD family protein [Flammeovirgaceae bacterium SG7u.132]WPO34459.1 RDD family protein [Flammeovirgaceae bacterium SG7u.111]